MRPAPAGPGVRALTYCSNIHPGESWADVMRNLESHVPAVKQAVAPDAGFPLGLRISSQAADECGEAQIAEFHRWREAHGCHVLTVNGFPYGAFHGRAVKQAVYAPDWRTEERVRYTVRLAELLSRLATADAPLSISTVPVAFKPTFATGDWGAVRRNVLAVLTHFDRIRQRGGPTIRLAIEPEPMCVLERTDEAVDFFARMDLPASLSDLLGLCLDCCHQAVEFESPADCLGRLRAAGIAIAKVQVSSALRALHHEIPALLAFDEPTYLHQVVARTQDRELRRFADLPELARHLETHADIEECRVHFHVPIFLEHLGPCGTTRFFLEDLLPRLDPQVPLEVETYSFHVLPPALRRDTVGESIARELMWVKEVIGA